MIYIGKIISMSQESQESEESEEIAFVLFGWAGHQSLLEDEGPAVREASEEVDQIVEFLVLIGLVARQHIRVALLELVEVDLVRVDCDAGVLAEL